MKLQTIMEKFSEDYYGAYQRKAGYYLTVMSHDDCCYPVMVFGNHVKPFEPNIDDFIYDDWKEVNMIDRGVI